MKSILFQAFAVLLPLIAEAKLPQYRRDGNPTKTAKSTNATNAFYPPNDWLGYGLNMLEVNALDGETVGHCNLNT